MTAKTASKPRTDSGANFAVTMAGINKRFGLVQANKDVDLAIRAGHIHGIVGENGAGKSTLMSILYGFYTADSGRININGKRFNSKSTADAIAMGIGMVHQHFMLVPNFSVLENVILGAEGGQNLRAHTAEARKTLTDLAGQLGLALDLDAKAGALPVSLQQKVEILKALYRQASILILDEPTGVLTPQETNQLFDILRTLKKQGVTILLITHKLREIMAVTDRVSVMRAGALVADLDTKKTSPPQLAQIMVGREVLVESRWHRTDKGEAVVEVKDLTLKGEGDVTGGKPLLAPTSFSVHAGEILGVAGVAGNGQSELLELLAGIRPPSGGSIRYHNHIINTKNPATPKDIKKLGVAHTPEDRHAAGIILPFSAAENAMLGYENLACNNGVLAPKIMRQHCADLMKEFDVRPPNPDLISSQFSGGNQQKLVLAREMSGAGDILLVGQPTRGVDIGAIAFIHQQLITMRDRGAAIILVSVELDEIMSLSDRIMVMAEGRVMGIESRTKTNLQKIGLLMAGVA